jgi:hypothetical protein
MRTGARSLILSEVLRLRVLLRQVLRLRLRRQRLLHLVSHRLQQVPLETAVVAVAAAPPPSAFLNCFHRATVAVVRRGLGLVPLHLLPLRLLHRRPAK